MTLRPRSCCLQLSVKGCSRSTGLFHSITTTHQLLTAQRSRDVSRRYCVRTFLSGQTPRIYARKRQPCCIHLTTRMVPVYSYVHQGGHNRSLPGMLETECDVDHVRVFTIVNCVFTIVNLTFTKVRNHLSNRLRLVAPALLSLETNVGDSPPGDRS